MSIQITKRDGTKEGFDADRINRSIERAAQGLTDPLSKVVQIASETELTLYDGITEEELDQATINAALQNVTEDLEFDTIATRLLIKTIYKKVLGDFKRDDLADLSRIHKEHFPEYIKDAVGRGLLDSRLASVFNLEDLASALDITRDGLYKYSGASTMLDRYFVKDDNKNPLETPQYFWMRVAMGMSYNEEDPNEWAKKFYEKMSKLEYLSSGSTNLGAGTPNPKLSNCFLMEVQDDMENIGKSVSDVLLLSKATGGIGMTVTRLRASGSILKSSNTVSSGPVPFLHVIDSAIRAVQRGGKKKGALCFYMENWHLDFQDFLDLKQNAGDDYRRVRTANTAVYLSDEFMKRVIAGDDWYLFDPNEVKDLVDLYGEDFSKRYKEYVEMAESGKIRMWSKMPARQQYKNILVSLQTTSHPWITWKDTINIRALNNNTGTITSSNLCTEITLPHSRDNIAVCNLLSVNMARHVRNGQIDWHLLEETTRLAMRQLDNLVDINQSPLVETQKADSENRAVGMGLMGFADTIEMLGYSYEDKEAYDLSDKIFEFISYMAIDESANLAEEKGAYKNFKGSMWSKGFVPVDTLEILNKERGGEMPIKKDSANLIPNLNWDILRERVKKGIRNATVMAIAPNANIGLVAGVTPGIDPRFAQMFSRNKMSGKYMEINPNLVAALKEKDLWTKTREEILSNHGDLSLVELIPEEIKRIYKNSFDISPYAFIEVAARAQKWIDQAISRNMYLDVRDIDEVMNIYSTAWDKGLKTTYYLHMKPRHTAEQSTIKVNKQELTGKKGFAVLSSIKRESVEPVVSVATDISIGNIEVKETVTINSNNSEKKFKVHLPEDPQDALLCDGCQ